MTLDQTIDDLARTLDRPHGGPQGSREWAATVRKRVQAVREDLRREAPDLRRRGDGWLDARGRSAERDRRRLLQRLTALGPKILEAPDADTSLRELRRLALDLQHYRQRVHDLAYDAVALELGGSE